MDRFVRCTKKEKEKKMEKEIKDGLNFVLGAVSKVKEEFDGGFQGIQSGFQGLIEKGAQDTSELSVNIRKYAQEGINYVQTILPKDSK